MTIVDIHPSLQHDEPDAGLKGRPAASIACVVIGRNEGQRLIDCLRSLGPFRAMTVYVDSGSTDGSPEIAAQMGIHVVKLDLRQPFTAGRARNAGFLAACQRFRDLAFVQFVDGDCMLDPDWIETAYNFMTARPDVAIVFGRRRERRIERSVYNALCDREWSGAPGAAAECGGDIFARVAALRDAGAYSPNLIAGEEPELCVRLRQEGWNIWRTDAEMTLHDANMTEFRQWWRRNTRAGYAFAEVSLLHWGSTFGIWKRSLLRSISWAGVLPLAIVVGALVHPNAVALLALYPIQIARIAYRNGWNRLESWRNGLFDTLGKFPELCGAAKYLVNCISGAAQTIIEYK